LPVSSTPSSPTPSPTSSPPPPSTITAPEILPPTDWLNEPLKQGWTYTCLIKQCKERTLFLNHSQFLTHAREVHPASLKRVTNDLHSEFNKVKNTWERKKVMGRNPACE
jgi:hypothetical protein